MKDDNQKYWLRPLPPCAHCPKPPTVEVVNARNAPLGAYCASCARRVLAKLRRETQRPS